MCLLAPLKKVCAAFFFLFFVILQFYSFVIFLRLKGKKICTVYWFQSSAQQIESDVNRFSSAQQIKNMREWIGRTRTQNIECNICKTVFTVRFLEHVYQSPSCMHAPFVCTGLVLVILHREWMALQESNVMCHAAWINHGMAFLLDTGGKHQLFIKTHPWFLLFPNKTFSALWILQLRCCWEKRDILPSWRSQLALKTDTKLLL